MTKALGIRSTGTPTKHEQKRYRAEFKALKLALANSPERVQRRADPTYREQNRIRHAQHRARRKIALKRLDMLADIPRLTDYEFRVSLERWQAAAIELGLAPAPIDISDLW